jgi:hypothetical protein
MIPKGKERITLNIKATYVCSPIADDEGTNISS